MKKILFFLLIQYASHAMQQETSEMKMMLAILGDKSDETSRLIEGGLNVHWKNDMGDSFLHYASSLGRVEIAQQLLAAGADINQLSEDGRTPLLNALRYNHPEFARWLIKQGADVSKGHIRHRTVLEYARASEFEGIRALVHQIDYLIKHKQEDH